MGLEITLQLISLAAGLIGIVAVIAAAIIVSRSKASEKTIELQDGLIKTYEQKDLETQKKINLMQEKIDHLQREVDVIKNIPLKDLSQALLNIASTQDTMLEMLKQALKREANNGANTK